MTPAKGCQGAAPRDLVVLAAGVGRRFGGLKQIDPVGPSGEALLDYAIHDALRAGVTRVVVVTRPEIEATLLRHLAPRWAREVEVRFAHQTLAALPTPHVPPPTRTRPWGTGHALLCAEPLLDAPFLVANGDDFYGAASYARLAQHMARSPGFALVGYPIRDTLSPHGGVSRALCVVARDGRLAGLEEVHGIEMRGGELVCRSGRGKARRLVGDELVSMNLWGLSPDLFPLLHRRFERFLEEAITDPEAELQLSTALAAEIDSGVGRVAVLETEEPWLGMTYVADRPWVVERLRQLVAEGLYPASLGAG